jgi:hypothetical protein
MCAMPTLSEITQGPGFSDTDFDPYETFNDKVHRIAGCELGAHRAASRLLPGRGLMLWVWASIVITNRLLEPRAARCRSGFSIPQWHWDPGCRA